MTSLNFVGHEYQRRSLERLLKTRRLPPSMIFAGPPGIGKRLAALELSRSLICEHNLAWLKDTPSKSGEAGQSFKYGGCVARSERAPCKNCRLFEIGNFPDFHMVQCLEKEASNIARVRELLSGINMTPFAGGCRVVLFNDAEYLSIAAANVLLKALEEPRPGTYYILVSASPSRLPATLLSRCQIWFFDGLKPGQIKSILQRRSKEGAQDMPPEFPVEDLAVLAEGSLQGIEDIAQRVESWRCLGVKLDLIHSGDLPAAINLASELGRDKETLRTNLQLMRIYARGRMHQSAQGPHQANWAILLTNLIAAERLIFERYLSPVNVLNSALLTLAENQTSASFTGFPGGANLLERITV